MQITQPQGHIYIPRVVGLHHVNTKVDNQFGNRHTKTLTQDCSNAALLLVQTSNHGINRDTHFWLLPCYSQNAAQ